MPEQHHRYAIPPRVWTDLPGSGTVLNETDATAVVTVDENGTVTFSVPMKWRPAGRRAPTCDDTA